MLFGSTLMLMERFGTRIERSASARRLLLAGLPSPRSTACKCRRVYKWKFGILRINKGVNFTSSAFTWSMQRRASIACLNPGRFLQSASNH